MAESISLPGFQDDEATAGLAALPRRRRRKKASKPPS
jgi:hypothetical protein